MTTTPALKDFERERTAVERTIQPVNERRCGGRLQRSDVDAGGGWGGRLASSLLP
jgi:hypothetical protein